MWTAYSNRKNREKKTMTKTTSPYDQLEKLFHEPKRLAIVSLLCTAKEGASFAELKRGCDLTDGNLNRHLNTLQQAGAVQLIKVPGKSRPQTVALLTSAGRAHFDAYLQALEGALKLAVDALHREAEIEQAPPVWGMGKASVNG